MLGRVQLVVDLLLLSLQPPALLQDSLIVVDLLEPWVLPDASQNLSLVISYVINHDLCKPVAGVERLPKELGISLIHHILYYK